MSLRAAALLLVVPLTLAGCLGSDPDPKDGDGDGAQRPRVAPSVWKADLTKAFLIRVASTIHYVDANDGTQLSLTQHLPQDLPDGTKVPTLLQITPYQSGRLYTPTGGTGPGGPSWKHYTDRGAAYIEADARGTNGSEGCLDFGGTKDREDAKAIVDWIRAQPWSNGIVVTDGISHPGMGSVVAHAAVPELTAALAHAPVVSYYQDEWLQGARFEDQLNGVFYQEVELSPAQYVDPPALVAQPAACTGRTVLDYNSPEGTFTLTWADRDLSRHLPEARVPILLTHGFIDQNVHPDHSQLYWDALPDDYPKYLVMGWWYHGWPDLSGHPAKTEEGATFTELRQRWLDTYLFGVDNGLLAEPRVLVEDSRGTWHESGAWPLAPSSEMSWYPGPDGELANATTDAGEVSYADSLQAYRGSWTDASAVFRSEPLSADMLVNGAPRVELVASSSATTTKWVVYLLDEAPDGSWQRITHGYADSHTHGGEDKWLTMTPNVQYTWTLQLMPTAVVVEQGHRVVLLVTSQDSRNVPDGGGRTHCWDDHRDPQGCYDPSGILPAESAGRAVNTIHVGPEGTRVTIAWVDPEATQKVPWPVE